MLTSQLVHQLLIICPLSFLAGFVDAVAGGGGLISLPAFLFAGVPVHLAYGTNKFCSCFGTLISTGKYLKSGKITLKLALLSAAGALIGSAVGARMVLALSERVLQICLMVILPVVAVFLLFNRNLGQDEGSPKNISSQSLVLRAVVIGLVLGWYDGFFGPGTGTFLVLAFSGLMGMSLVNASGNAKVVNLASNLAALVTYLLGGAVIFTLAVPGALCNVAGNWLGATLAIKKGAKFIRPLIFVSIGLLLVRILTDLIA